MKRSILAVLSAFGIASASAEQLDYWLYADGKITDGAWTFSASADNKKQMTVGQVSETAGEYPTVPTPLDFSKPVKDASENTYVITTLGCAFVNNSGYVARTPAQYVSALTLPGEGLTRLNDYSLGKLVNAVGTLHFPSSLYSIGRMAFLDDSNLTVDGSEFANITVFTSGDAFKNVKVVGELDLRKVSGTIENNNFANTKITAVRFGPGLTQVQGGYADGAFVGCTKLKTVIFDPDSSVKIGQGGVFQGCTALEEIDLRAVNTLTDGGRGEGYAPFGNCTGLKKVVLGGKLEQWDNVVFAGCSSLAEVHYYGAPCAELGSPVFKNAGDSRMIATYVHLDSSDAAAKAAWDAYTAGGELNGSDSCWNDSMISGSTAALRPLLLYSQKSVSIALGVDADMESGVIGTFIVSRGEDDSLAGAVDVAYTLSGTAVNGVDYEKLSGVVSIPGGERSVELQVIPRFVGAVSTKDVTVTLAEGDYEIVTGEDSATISVSSCYRSVSVAKLVDADEGKGTYGYFEVSRGENDAVTTPLAVEFAVSGTAISGKTYRTPESPVVIPAGERSVKLRVAPLDDQETTTDATVIVTLTGDNYAIEGDPATMMIVNGATFGGWKLYSGYMTDGVWKFTVQQNNRDDRKFPDGVNHLYVQTLQSYPEVPSELNFDKVMINCDNDRPYAIREFQSPLKAAAAVLESVVLPDDVRYPFVLSSSGSVFKDCTNLKSVTPFLPAACESLKDAFAGCTSLASPLVVLAGTSIGEAGAAYEQFSGCKKIPSADLSQSTVKSLSRSLFDRCLSLEWVKLPACIEKFGSADSDTFHNRDPFWNHNNVPMADNASTPKLYFCGTTMPLLTTDIPSIKSLEFMNGLESLTDNAFSHYTGLTNVVINGAPPATIGENIFSGGFKEKSITVNVPLEYINEWREIADNKVLTKEEGGTWTSGTTQLINVYGEPKRGTGTLIFMR